MFTAAPPPIGISLATCPPHRRTQCPDKVPPYAVDIPGLVKRFGDTTERRKLLTGLLKFRAELHQIGVVRGFQWIDGSFVEYIEQNQGRAPNDIDVVTFFYIPEGHTQISLLQSYRNIFDGTPKRKSSIDAYFVPLDQVKMEEAISESIYWDGLWSHTRDGLRKGYVQVDLANTDDENAKAELQRIAVEGGGS